MAYDLGDVVGLSVETRNAAGVLENAGSVTVTIGLPDGTSATIGPVAPTSAGVYQYDYPTTMAGRHTARWIATGANQSAYSDAFDVRPADPGYVISLSDAKAHLNKTSTVTVDDEELRPFIEAAGDVIERHTGKTIARRTVVERKTESYSSQLWLSHRPVISVTSIATLDGLTTWPVTSTYLDVNPDYGLITRLTGNYWHGNLLVTYVAGMSVIPANYAMAGRIIVQHLWQSQRGQRGGPRVGGMDPGIPGLAPSGFAIPNAALELLGAPGPMVA